MTQKGNEQELKDAYREWRRAEQKTEAAEGKCEAAWNAADDVTWICRQPMPRNRYTVLLCLPNAYANRERNRLCALAEELVVVAEKKEDEYRKLVRLQEKQTEKESHE